MFDLRTYHATKHLPGGPIYVQEHELAEHYMFSAMATADDRPLTTGRRIGGLISVVLLMGTGLYLILAW